MEERGSFKHGPRLDDQMEQEDEPIVRAGQPAHTEEWRQTEPFEENYLEEELPPSEQPGTPAGLTPADVDRRFDIARWLEPHKFPADRDTMLGYLRDTGAPDEVIDAISRLPARHEFTRSAEVLSALGLPTEHR
jgi:hypothetical protein